MAVYIDAFDTVTINQSIETNLYSAICREQTRGAIDKCITKENYPVHRHLITQQHYDVSYINPRPAVHCRVLPPGEWNGIIAVSLPIESESLVTVTITVFPENC